MLESGQLFRIDCKCNYELIRELASFGKEIIVLSPKAIQDCIYDKVSSLANEYKLLRTKSS